MTLIIFFFLDSKIDILPQYEKKRDFDSSLRVKKKSPKEVYSPEHPVNSVTKLLQKKKKKTVLQLTIDTFEVLLS